MNRPLWHDEPEYPASDGMPMADNTRQWDAIVRLKWNLDRLLPDAFVGGDLLWYPVRGRPDLRMAPDVLVAFGRPKGDRGSYLQWCEDGVVPHVVVEVWSPGNRAAERAAKVRWYDEHGVEEVITWDPDRFQLAAFTRGPDGRLHAADVRDGWTSPRMGVTLRVAGDTLDVRGPDGEPFLMPAEVADQRDAERARADAERARAEAERAHAAVERARADALQRELDRLRAALAAAPPSDGRG